MGAEDSPLLYKGNAYDEVMSPFTMACGTGPTRVNWSWICKRDWSKKRVGCRYAGSMGILQQEWVCVSRRSTEKIRFFRKSAGSHTHIPEGIEGGLEHFVLLSVMLVIETTVGSSAGHRNEVIRGIGAEGKLL